MKRFLALTVAIGLSGCTTAMTDYMIPGYTPHDESANTLPATVQPAYSPPQPRPPADAAADLRALKTLRDDGLITEQEYQAKKAEILNRM